MVWLGLGGTNEVRKLIVTMPGVRSRACGSARTHVSTEPAISCGFSLALRSMQLLLTVLRAILGLDNLSQNTTSEHLRGLITQLE
jgi:hypothetical protein